MKRLLCFLFVAVIVCMALPVRASAVQTDTVRNIYLEDGAYITITVRDNGNRASSTKSGSTIYEYFGSDGVKQWTAALNGTFTYNGSSATCTSSSCNVSISNSAWYTISKSAGKSGNTATASITMGRKILGVTVESLPIDMSLSCDANGNLS